MPRKPWLEKDASEDADAMGELDKVIANTLGISLTALHDALIIPVEKRGEIAKAAGVNPGCLSQMPTIRSLRNGVKKAVEANGKWWRRQTQDGVPLSACMAQP